MRIGIDIDNVVSNFDDMLLKEYLKHDKKLRNTGIINEKVDYRHGMFDWSQEEENEFYHANIERVVTNLKPIEDSKQMIDKLKNDGNEIYIISGRNNGEYQDPKKMTEKWLRKYDINYDQLILTDAYDKQAKANECVKNNIDIMIEDSVSTCLNIKKKGIKVLLMNTRYNQYNRDLERVMSWKEIYSKISSLYPKKDIEKINVILDTDAYNECDDQFAISYMIKSQDRFNIEAITVAPYHHESDISIQEGTDKSYDEIIKICNYLNYDTSNKVYKGSTDYVSDGYQYTTDAVEKIIEIANKNEKTYVIAIGAITNVALAIKKAPEIINKIEVIWLGGNSPLCKDNMEYNFKQDVEAVKIVLNSKVKLTIIPCKGVASNLMISIHELEYYIKGKNELCNYLCSRFHNDGIHGIQERRVIWDISAIAYLINKEWFEVRQIECPDIKEDTSYEFIQNDHKIEMVTYLNANKIYHDLFQKITDMSNN